MPTEELKRKVLGIMQSSSVYPLRIAFDDKKGVVRLYHDDKLLVKMSLRRFNKLTPNAILSKAKVQVKRRP